MMRRHLAVLASAFAALAPLAAQEAPFVGPGPWMVHARGGDEAARREVASWGEHFGDYAATKGFLLIEADAERLERLRALGFTVELDAERTAAMAGDPRAPWSPTSIPGFPCYRTVEETFAAAQALVAARPDLASVVDIGDSWQKVTSPGTGYDLLVLKLTNAAVAGPKPRLFVVSSVHAREYTPAEISLRFAEELVAGHGSEADATWILDHHELHLLLQANPDGRKRAETGLSWRKNVNNNYCAGTNSRGADLNRNYEFEWNCCGGSSSLQCQETYHGASAASEPEVAAIQTYARALFADVRPPDLETPAPDDTPGLFLDVHSFSQLVLTPWGFQDPNVAPPPNGVQFRTAARKLAWFSGYDPSLFIYTVDGASTDFGYGDLGVATLAFEVGTSFFESCASFAADPLPGGLGMLRYSARVARAPYLLPSGPDVVEPGATPLAVAPGDPVAIAAHADDGRYSTVNGIEPTQPIAAVEAYLDTPPWTPGAPAPLPLAAADGAFDEVAETAPGALATGALAAGRHTLFLRAQDAAGDWGPVAALFFWVLDPATAPFVSGTVRTAGSGAPLAATVAVGPFATATDPSTGAFSLQVPPGTYELVARAPAHREAREPGLVAAELDSITREILLEPYSTPLADDGEGPNPGWTAQAPWALTTEAAASPTHSWTDSPGGEYADFANTSLTSPVIDLTGATGTELAFRQIYDLETSWDFGRVEFSTDGGANWIEAVRYTGTATAAWQLVTLPLPALDGIAQARVRFRLTSDGSITRDGWHVDDIELRALLPHPLFADDFESQGFTRWSYSTP